MDTDTNPERIIYPTQAERVTVKVATTPALWEVLTAEDARYIAQMAAALLSFKDWQKLRAYADAVDAMTAPTRLVYETE